MTITKNVLKETFYRTDFVIRTICDWIECYLRIFKSHTRDISCRSYCAHIRPEIYAGKIQSIGQALKNIFRTLHRLICEVVGPFRTILKQRQTCSCLPCYNINSLINVDRILLRGRRQFKSNWRFFARVSNEPIDSAMSAIRNGTFHFFKKLKVIAYLIKQVFSVRCIAIHAPPTNLNFDHARQSYFLSETLTILHCRFSASKKLSNNRNPSYRDYLGL